MAKAYWVTAYHAIHDPDKMAAYAALAAPAIKSSGGKFLVRGPAVKTYDSGLMERVVIVEFPSLEAALAAHETPEYKAALEALGDGVTRDMRVVEGVA